MSSRSSGNPLGSLTRAPTESHCIYKSLIAGAQTMAQLLPLKAPVASIELPRSHSKALEPGTPPLLVTSLPKIRSQRKSQIPGLWVPLKTHSQAVPSFLSPSLIFTPRQDEQGMRKSVGAGVERPGRELLLTSSTLSFSLSLAIAYWNIRNMFSTSLTGTSQSTKQRDYLKKKSSYCK